MPRKSRNGGPAGLDAIGDCRSTASLSSTASALTGNAVSQYRSVSFDHAIGVDPLTKHAGQAASQTEETADEQGEGESDNQQVGYTSASEYRRAIYGTVMTALYILTWIVNSEMVQGLTDGSMAASFFSSHSSSQEQQQQQQEHRDTTNDNIDIAIGDDIGNGIDAPSLSSLYEYNQPTFITWFSYNYMMLSWFVVLWWHRPTSAQDDRSWNIASRCKMVANYMQHQWAGRLGMWRAAVVCTGIGYTMQLLNIAFILGLNCIPVSVSNTVFQLQTGIVVLISVAYLGDTFTKQQAWGMLFSAVGVGLIVLPPMLRSDSDDAEDDDQSVCPNVQLLGVDLRPMLIGVLATVVAATTSAVNYVSWGCSRQNARWTKLSPPSQRCTCAAPAI